MNTLTGYWKRSDIPQKYYDGKPGHYLCHCKRCLGRFYGDKRDMLCPSCHYGKPKLFFLKWLISHIKKSTIEKA